jgi:hypothetical protein
MLNIMLHVDNARLFDRIDKGPKRLVYAVANALNVTGRRIQEVEHEHVVTELKPRTGATSAFLQQQIAVIQRGDWANASRGKLRLTVHVGVKPRLLLSEYEAGGPRLPFVGKEAAVPVIGGARATIRAPIAHRFYFASMQLVRGAGGVNTKKVVWYGKGGIFEVVGPVGALKHGGVFQRTGKNKIKLLYAFEDWKPLQPRLGFEITAQRVAQEFFSQQMNRELEAAKVWQQ